MTKTWLQKIYDSTYGNEIRRGLLLAKTKTEEESHDPDCKCQSYSDWLKENYPEDVEAELKESVPESSKPRDLSVGKKPPLSLVPPVLIREVSWCMEDGAKKRSPYNWRESSVSAMQLLDKILRHTLDTIDGQDLTEDSKLSNLASAAADIAVYLDAKQSGTLVDDRPKRVK